MKNLFGFIAVAAAIGVMCGAWHQMIVCGAAIYILQAIKAEEAK